jgi:hypothetical protein
MSLATEEGRAALPGEAGRRHATLTTVFFALATIGIVTAAILGVRAVQDQPDLSVSDARVRRDGLTAIVQVTVHNDGSGPLCPVIQIAARNRDGLDIAKQQATPVDGDGHVDPRATVGFRAQFDQLTARDYQGLDKFVGFVDGQHPC